MEENVVKPPDDNALHAYKTKISKIAEILVKTLHYATTSTELEYIADLINEYIEENKTKSTALLFFIQQASFTLSKKLKKSKKASEKCDGIPISEDLRINIPSAALLLQTSEEEAKLYNKNIENTRARSLIQSIIDADLLLNSDTIYRNLSLLGKLIIEEKDYENIKDLNRAREYTSAIKQALDKSKRERKDKHILSSVKYTNSDEGGKIDDSAEKTKSLIHTLRTQTNSSRDTQSHITQKQTSSVPIGLK